MSALLLASLLGALAGCVKSKVVIYVNPDGSGNVVVSRFYDAGTVQATQARLRQIAAQLEQDPGQAGVARPAKATDPFFSEKALRREARMYGPGAKFVKARRLDIDGGRGSIAIYRFTDINDILIAPDPEALQRPFQGPQADPFGSQGTGDDEEDVGVRGGVRIEFSMQTGAVSRLKMLLPSVGGEDEDEDSGENDDADEDSDGGEDAEEDFVGEMGGEPYGLQDIEPLEFLCDENIERRPMALAVEVVLNGKIQKCNASHTNALNPVRIVLLDLDTTRRPEGKAVKGGDDRSDLYAFYDIEQVLRSIRKTPCAVVETNREVVVEFK